MRTTIFTHCLLLPLLLGPAVAAQVVATLPTGYTNAVGAGIDGSPFSAQPFYRVQYCHESRLGTPLPNIVALDFRRDKANVRAQNTARNVTVEVVMGHGSIGRFDADFAANYTVDRTVAVASRTVALPATIFPQNAASVPEPWTARIPLDAPFSDAGTHALLIEIATTSSASTDYIVESGPTAPGQLFNLSTGSSNDLGCTATGRSTDFSLVTSLFSHARSEMMRLEVDVRAAPAGAPVWLNVSAIDPALTLPGLCGRLHALPDVQLTLGNAAANGELLDKVYRLPWIGALTTAPVYMQAMALDPGQSGLPLVLSNDRASRWPAAPTMVPSHASAHTQDPLATRASVVTTGATALVGLEL